MNNYFSSIKNIVLLAVLVLSATVFCALNKLLFFNIAIILIDALVIYLLIFRNNYLLTGMALVFNLTFLFLSLSSLEILWIFCIGLIIAGISYFYVLNSSDKKISLIYSLVIALIVCQGLFLLIMFPYSILAKTIFVLLVYYLLSGLIQLNIDNQLRPLAVAKYSLVFISCVVILLLNNQYF